MVKLRHVLKYAVASWALLLFAYQPGFAQSARLDQLFEQLKLAEAPTASAIEQEIWVEWSRSGSASVDLLLERGREALGKDDIPAAIDHFSAVVDHAPDFAEGYNARATAYFRAGLYGPSIDDIGKALALNPRHFGAMSGMAIILEELGYYEDALVALREIQAIYPAREGLLEQIERLEGRVGGAEL